jgi:hypothetical protein
MHKSFLARTVMAFLTFSSLCIHAQAPTIGSFSPLSGSVGTLITVNGTNLGNPTAFTVGGATAVVVSNTGSVLVGLVMPGAVYGSVYVTTSGGAVSAAGNFTVVPTPFPVVQQGNKLVGTGAWGSAALGGSVALSADGNTAIVGGVADSSYIGAVWIFTRSGGIWMQQGPKLVGKVAVGSTTQGCSVALSADGNTAMVGGWEDNQSAGAAWIFTRSGGIWTQQGYKLIGTGIIGNSHQGHSVALSADGNTAISGGYGDNGGAGAAWIFKRNGGIWTQQGNKLVGSGAVGDAYQGFTVALSADGNTAFVGGEFDDGGTGAAWAFTQSGGNWTQQGGKLVGTGAVGFAYQSTSLALSADGNSAIIGAYNDNSGVGAIWVFIRIGGIWVQQGNKLVGTGNVGPPIQGFFSSLSADGNTAIVGGYADNTNAGAAWVYTRSGGTWSQQGNKLVGIGADGSAQLGPVALSADGTTALVGGPNDANGVGAVWVFVSCPNTAIALSSSTGSDSQTICLDSAITSISYSTSGITGVSVSGLPPGVSNSWASNVETISGKPSAPGTFKYVLTFIGSCGPIIQTGSITVSQASIALSSAVGSDSQLVCINTPITAITYSTTGALNATVIGLPTGLITNLTTNAVTITGTPSFSGTYPYTVTIVGGCGTVSMPGTLTVNQNNTMSLTSPAGTDTQTICKPSAIVNITYTSTGATGANVTGLPIGVTGSWASNIETISGSSINSGIFNYTVNLTGGCGTYSKTGTLNVNLCAGIATNGALTTEINLFPNPSLDKVSIHSSNMPDHSVLYLYNAVGQVIQSVELTSEETILQRAGLSAGVYMYRVLSNNNQFSSGKLVFVD